MHILISTLVILLVLLSLYILWVYNQLIHLQINKDNVIHTIATQLDVLFDLLAQDTILKKNHNKSIIAWENADNVNEKINAFNLLEEDLDSFEEKIKIKHILEKTANGRRHYNHITKLLNAKLQIFPSNIIGNILGYKQAPLFALTDKEKKGEHPDIKW